MQPRVNYRPSDDIAGAVRGASLAWATEKDEQEGTATPEDDNQGGGSTPPQGGELEG